ncbi:MAG: GntR family transcriptional regulator [Tunicatimonas sp.]|uniref:GntR family transcriptional regulator n=1 Tax=Tunicatimonas sp. TaxID=1940096 RepID=UPI003C746FC1
MEFNDQQAIYLQIADYICEKILLEQWAVEERIPSVRDLAATMEVNPNTVVRSYDFLQQRDIIYNKRGLGYFASADAITKVRVYRKERFLETELPDFFRTLYLLDITLEEIQERYQNFVAETYPTP